MVWFPHGVSRYSFITWLAIKNRLSTGNRMRQWGMIQGCELYGERDETRDHLYSAYPYSYTLWEAPACKFVGSCIHPDWQWKIQCLQRMGTKGVDFFLARLLFQTLIYHSWREWNTRRHQQPRNTTNQMRRLTDKAMKNMIYSLKYRPETS